MKVRILTEYGYGELGYKEVRRALKREVAYMDRDSKGDLVVFGRRPRPAMQAAHYQPSRPRCLGLDIIIGTPSDKLAYGPTEMAPGGAAYAPWPGWHDRLQTPGRGR